MGKKRKEISRSGLEWERKKKLLRDEWVGCILKEEDTEAYEMGVKKDGREVVKKIWRKKRVSLYLMFLDSFLQTQK